MRPYFKVLLIIVHFIVIKLIAKNILCFSLNFVFCIFFFKCIHFIVGKGVVGMSKSETEEMIEIEIDGREKQECLEEG